MVESCSHSEVGTPEMPLLSWESGNTSCHHMRAQESSTRLLPLIQSAGIGANCVTRRPHAFPSQPWDAGMN